MSASGFNRRLLLTTGPVLTLGLIACQRREFVCTDTSGLHESDRVARSAVKYEDRAVDAHRTCEACQQWEPHDQDGCGGCKLVRGPVHPLGTCQLFAKRG